MSTLRHMQLLERALYCCLSGMALAFSQRSLCTAESISYDPWPQSLSMAVMMSAPSFPENGPFLPCELLFSEVSPPVIAIALTFPVGWPMLPCSLCSSRLSTCKMFLLAVVPCTSQTVACCLCCTPLPLVLSQSETMLVAQGDRPRGASQADFCVRI